MLTVSMIVASIKMDQVCGRSSMNNCTCHTEKPSMPHADDMEINDNVFVRQTRLANIDFDKLFALGQDAVVEVCDMSQWCDGPAHYKPRTFIMREQLKSAQDVYDWLLENAISITLALESAEQFNALKVTK